MTSKISNLWLMLGAIYLLMLLLDPGHLGSVDTERRLQTTHWLWGAGPSIIPDDEHAYIITAPDGFRHYWYGVGQSILMVPGDILGTLIAHIAASYAVAPADELNELRETVVALSTFPLIAALTAFVLYRLFCVLGLAPASAIASVIVAFLATRLLYFSIIHQENGAILLFSISACLCLILWIHTNAGKYLAFAGLFLGFNLLTRLTTVFDIITFGLFAAYLFHITGATDKHDTWTSRAFDVVKFFVPLILAFILLDRMYHFYRFEELWSTYLDLQARRVIGEGILPPTWPWITPFWEGFLSAFASPMYGILFYDPLVLVTLYLCVFYRQLLPKSMLSFVFFSFVLLLVYAAFYARYETPGGMPDWGNRYSATPVIFITAFAYPLWMICRKHLKIVEKGFALLLFVYSVFIQIMSVPFMFFLEVMQIERNIGALYQTGALWGGPRIMLRIQNLFCDLFGWPAGCAERLFEEIPDASHRINVLLFHAMDILNIGPRVGAALVVAWSVALLAVLLVLLWIFVRNHQGRRRRGSVWDEAAG